MIDYTYIALILTCILAVLIFLYYDKIRWSRVVLLAVMLISAGLMGWFINWLFFR